MLIRMDGSRFPLADDEQPILSWVRFRTLDCYPLTGAVESEATIVDAVIRETLPTPTSERYGRAIDRNAHGARMARKKRDGYF